jgi:hypothetical protein
MTDLCSGIREGLDRDGYAILRGVFSGEEVTWMRREVRAMLAKRARPHNGGLSCTPQPGESVLASRLLDDARVSPWKGELPSIIHLHQDTVHDWHVDLEPPAPATVFNGTPASMYKIAIYLQDHLQWDGLSVIPGSHKEANTPRAALHLSTRAGDLVIFDLRIRHAGHLPIGAERMIATLTWWLYRVRLVNDPGRHRLYRRFRHLLQPGPAAERLAIFLTFATSQDIARTYAAFIAREPEIAGPDVRLRRQPVEVARREVSSKAFCNATGWSGEGADPQAVRAR